jgi:Zn-dependent peptidase ImmA (M78 family)
MRFGLIDRHGGDRSVPRPTVPVTGAVVEWAIREAGYDPAELAKKLKLSTDTLRAWISESAQPRLTQLRKLAAKVKRPLATFLLPKPPAAVVPAVEFRSPPGTERRELNPSERRYLREAVRLQRFLSWVAKEIGDEPVRLPQERTQVAAATVAQRLRDRFDVSVEEQVEWPSPNAAFSAWRRVMEEQGALVLLFSMGRESCRGFSLWDDYVPLTAVNTTGWLPGARTFTLFHEFGHLITRTPSACLQARRRLTSVGSDTPERWAEEFAAALLMPADAVLTFVAGVHDKSPEALSSAVANHFWVSRLAAALRLVELDYLSWKDYEDLPRFEGTKRGGGKGRDRAQQRIDQYGSRATQLVSRGLERDVIGRGEVLDYFDVPEPSLDRLIGSANVGE